MSGSMLDAAVAMAEAGWSIFPCHWPIQEGSAVACSCREGGACSNIGKHPRSKHGCLDAVADPDRIARYWCQYPLANIGVATGEINNVTVLDVDPRHGGPASLSRLTALHGPLPPTLRSQTGSGGDHIIFQRIPGVRNSASKLGAGLDIRGDGGLIIAPPSLHESGERYRWLNELSPAAAPTWLSVALLSTKTGGKVAAPPDKWRSLFNGGADEGSRNDAVVAMAGHLLSRRLDPLLVLNIMKLWNDARLNPPLPEGKIIEIVNWICGRMLNR
jgi:hypothetical protein